VHAADDVRCSVIWDLPVVRHSVNLLNVSPATVRTPITSIPPGPFFLTPASQSTDLTPTGLSLTETMFFASSGFGRSDSCLAGGAYITGMASGTPWLRLSSRFMTAPHRHLFFPSLHYHCHGCICQRTSISPSVAAALSSSIADLDLQFPFGQYCVLLRSRCDARGFSYVFAGD